jgi:hypothetical protein
MMAVTLPGLVARLSSHDRRRIDFTVVNGNLTVLGNQRPPQWHGGLSQAATGTDPCDALAAVCLGEFRPRRRRGWAWSDSDSGKARARALTRCGPRRLPI